MLLNFNAEGDALFASITKDNVGRVLAIFLDGAPISMPVIRQEITGGVATISGGFTPTEARELVRNLNYGALPVAISLISRVMAACPALLYNRFDFSHIIG